MGIKLIPNNLTVSEQFAKYNQFIEMVQRWDGRVPWDAVPWDAKRIDTDRLLKESGVRCYLANYNTRLAGLEIVDTRAYIFFVLKWAR